MFVVSQWNIFNLRFARSSDAHAIYDTAQPSIYIYICNSRKNFWRIPSSDVHNASHQTRLRPRRSGWRWTQKSVARVPLMSRHICRSIGRRTLINKGYSKEIAIIYTLRAWAAIACRSVTIFYRTYASLYVCMHTCWCHVTRAFSFHARCMWCPLLRNQSTAAARHDHCVSSLHLCLSLSAIALPPRLGSNRNSEFRLD